MPASVILQNLAYATPDHTPLFTGLNLVFGPRRTGLVGRNGTGKSTLLRLIAGELSPTTGTVTLTGTVGLLVQSVQLDSAATLADALGVTTTLACLTRLEAGNGTLADAEAADWTLPSRIDAALAALRLPLDDLARPLASLSGGQRTRLSLAALTLNQPDWLLLDEPTNNLDADGRAAVAYLLRSWRGGAIVVSHDRTLLRQMDEIVEITTLGVKTYGGNWDHYAERKTQERETAASKAQAAASTVLAVDRKLQAIAERKARKDGAGSRQRRRNDMPKILLNARANTAENTSGQNARLASRLRSEASAALEAARAQIEVMTPLSARLSPTDLPAGKTILTVIDLSGGPDPDHPVIRGFNLSIVGPERIAITGPNGSGKTSLLRLLTGDLPALGGTVRLSARQAVLDQNVGMLVPDLTIRDNFLALNPGADENTCRAALARFMFRADAAMQLVGTLSGGEMLRAGLACTIGGTSPPELLILDEPTNHLDIEAIEAVETGLLAYDGALLVVSHDRDFLEAVGIQRELVLR